MMVISLSAWWKYWRTAVEYYNSMFSFGTSPDQSYRKYHLVPFGEFIPLKFLFGWVAKVFPVVRFFARRP